MAKTGVKAKKTATVEQTVITSFKAFNADFTCNSFQYEVGKSYEHKGEVARCSSGFHACENPFDVLNYYPLVGSRFGTVEQSGALSRDDEDSKIASEKITITAELTLPDFIKRAVGWLVERTKDAATTGDGANAATTGDYANATTTGYEANAATTGSNSIAAALGPNSTATAGEGGAIILTYWEQDKEYKWHLIAIRSSKVGENGIKPNVTYRLNRACEFEEVER